MSLEYEIRTKLCSVAAPVSGMCFLLDIDKARSIYILVQFHCHLILHNVAVPCRIDPFVDIPCACLAGTIICIVIVIITTKIMNVAGIVYIIQKNMLTNNVNRISK